MLSQDLLHIKESGRWVAGSALLRGHDILPGDRTVILWRKSYDDPDRHDEERFEMLTLEVQSPEAGKQYQLPGDKVRAFYSVGNAVWGMGSYAVDLRGGLRFESITDDQAIVALDLEGPLIGLYKMTPAPEPQRLRFTLQVNAIDRGSLTPWLRGQIPHPKMTRLFGDAKRY